MNQQQRAVVPEGWKLVPVEPTEIMQDAGVVVMPTVDCHPYDAGMVYKAMLSAAPTDDKLTPDEAQPAAWVGLTADEMLEALIAVDPATKRLPIGFARFAQAIEAKLKEKNT
jgi:hypothetical protein